MVRFGQLNTILDELVDEINEKQKECANLKDAESEIESLLEDDACK
jgi:hypothetical protein